jgi:hypothetical protein
MLTWIWTTFWIAFGRASPRALPSSYVALLEAAVLYVVISAVDAALVLPGVHPIGFGIADLVYTCMATTACLAVRSRMFRLPQTLLAMLGVGSWLTLPSLALNGIRGLAPALVPKTPAPIGIQLLLAGILVWSILAVGRILRDAMDVDFFTGMTVAVTYFLVDYVVLIALPSRLFN